MHTNPISSGALQTKAGTIRVATQNIQWGGDPAPGGDGQPRLTRLLPHLARLDADILVLTEHKSGERGAELESLLRETGYPYLIHRTPGYRALGTAIASRLPVAEIELPISPSVDRWRSTVVQVGSLAIAGFYFPLGDAKAIYWDWLLENAAQLSGQDVLLIGDFNTGKHLIDEVGQTFDCTEKHAALEQLGFIDTWRTANPTARDYTWYSSAGNGFRLDYVWSTPSMGSRIAAVRHDHEARLSGVTDHAAIVVDVRLSE